MNIMKTSFFKRVVGFVLLVLIILLGFQNCGNINLNVKPPEVVQSSSCTDQITSHPTSIVESSVTNTQLSAYVIETRTSDEQILSSDRTFNWYFDNVYRSAGRNFSFNSAGLVPCSQHSIKATYQDSCGQEKNLTKNYIHPGNNCQEVVAPPVPPVTPPVPPVTPPVPPVTPPSPPVIPPPDCPNPLPAFQCEAAQWSDWSKPLGLCGTRTRICNRTLPATCQQPTTEVQTDTRNCVEDPPGTLTPQQPCTVYSQYGQGRCDSSFVFDLEAITAGAWAFISLPSSTVLTIPLNPTMNNNGQTNGGKFSLSATTMYPSCAAMMVELNITNRRGVIIGIKNAQSPLAEIPNNMLIQDESYTGIIPNSNTEQALYEKCYVRQFGPMGQGDRAEISYSIPSRPDSLDKRYSCVIDPAQGPWFLNIRYSYAIPRLNTSGQFVMPSIGMCTLGIR